MLTVRKKNKKKPFRFAKNLQIRCYENLAKQIDEVDIQLNIFFFLQILLQIRKKAPIHDVDHQFQDAISFDLRCLCQYFYSPKQIWWTHLYWFQEQHKFLLRWKMCRSLGICRYVIVIFRTDTSKIVSAKVCVIPVLIVGQSKRFLLLIRLETRMKGLRSMIASSQLSNLTTQQLDNLAT